MMNRQKNIFFTLQIALILLFPILNSCNFRKTEESSCLAKKLPDKPKEITLDKYMSRLRTIKAQFGSDSFDFIFDTGGGLTLLTPDLADKVGCTPFGRITCFRMTGERIDVQRCGEVEFYIDGIPMVREATIIDLMSLLPKDWPKLGGLFSLDTFRDHTITLDLSKNRLTVETIDSSEDRIASMKPINIRINHQTGGWGLDVFVEIEAAEGSLWFELDTGNMSEVLIAPHAIEQLGLTIPTSDTETGSYDPDVFETTLNIVGLGSMIVKARKQEMIYDGLLNASTLEQLVLTLDLSNGRMWAKMSEDKLDE
jgi:predicted aspartyl protease